MTHDHSDSHDPSREPADGLQLTCHEICDFVMAYLDGELPPREQAIFDAHLRLCRECVRYLDSYQATVKLAKQSHETSPCDALPPVPEDLVKAILAARKARG